MLNRIIHFKKSKTRLNMKYGLFVTVIFTMLLYLAISLSFAQASTSNAKIISIDGEVHIMRGGGDKPFKAFLNMHLKEGDRVITGRGSSAKVELDNEIVITLSPNTRINLSELRGSGTTQQTAIFLQSGGIGSTVKNPLMSTARYEIKTPTAVMGVKGTEFFTQYNNGEIDVRVITGAVEVTASIGATIPPPSPPPPSALAAPLPPPLPPLPPLPPPPSWTLTVVDSGVNTVSFVIQALQQVSFTEQSSTQDLLAPPQPLTLEGLDLVFIDHIWELSQTMPELIPETIVNSIGEARQQAIESMNQQEQNINIAPDDLTNNPTPLTQVHITAPTTAVGTSPTPSPLIDGGNIPPQATTIINGVTIVSDSVQGWQPTLGALISPQGATVNYQWQIADIEQGTYTNIGANSNTLNIIPDYTGKYIRVIATGTANYSGQVTSIPFGSVPAFVNEVATHWSGANLEVILAYTTNINLPHNTDANLSIILEQFTLENASGELITPSNISIVEYGNLRGILLVFESYDTSGQIQLNYNPGNESSYRIFDDNGNYVFNQILSNIIISMRQTAIPVIITHAQTVNTATIDILGMAEANAIITITGGAQLVTGISDGQGFFNISVTLTENTVNNLSVTAQADGKHVSEAATVAITLEYLENL